MLFTRMLHKPVWPARASGLAVALEREFRCAFFGSTWWMPTRPSMLPMAKPSRSGKAATQRVWCRKGESSTRYGCCQLALLRS